MKKFQHIVSAALLVIAASSMISTTANAQSGSLLCGISVGPMAILVERTKPPEGKDARKRDVKYCRMLSNIMAQDLRKKGINMGGVIHYKPTGCEDVAQNISGGKSRYDICEQMEIRNKANGLNPYTVIYKPNGTFAVTRD